MDKKELKYTYQAQRNFHQHNPPANHKAEPMDASTFPFHARLLMRVRILQDENEFEGQYGWIIFAQPGIHGFGVSFTKSGIVHRFPWTQLLELHPDQEEQSVDTPFVFYWSVDGRNCYPCIKGSENHMSDGVTPFYNGVAGGV